jgi:hypothetical protein
VLLCGQTDGWTPLLIASEKGHVDSVRALVELGAAVNQAKVGLLDMSLGLVVCTHLTVCGFCVSECCCGALVCEGVWRVVVDKGCETRLTLCAHVGMRGWLCMWSAR